jgi:hypothetical protein
MGRRSRIAALTAVIFLLSAVLVVPAFGGPSPLGVAKKALKTAKWSQSAARKARSAADRANSAAATANSNATTAFNRAVAADLGPHMVYITRQVAVSYIPGSDFGTITIGCPAGYHVAGSAMSPGAIQIVAEAVGSTAVTFTGYNPSETSVYSYYAHVQCVESSGYSIARNSAEQTKRLARQASAEFAKTHHK